MECDGCDVMRRGDEAMGWGDTKGIIGESAKSEGRYIQQDGMMVCYTTHARHTRLVKQTSPPQRRSHRQQHHMPRVESDSECEARRRSTARSSPALRVACMGLCTAMEVRREDTQARPPPESSRARNASDSHSARRQRRRTQTAAQDENRVPRRPRRQSPIAAPATPAPSWRSRAACPPGARRPRRRSAIPPTLPSNPFQLSPSPRLPFVLSAHEHEHEQAAAPHSGIYS
ncbi:hypothetical protein B0H12DRAFT_541008 [Mycena haematopus]|nr:hypothetical protein B0H12DRAFT_541008 [Mycena haematopus]